MGLVAPPLRLFSEVSRAPEGPLSDEHQKMVRAAALAVRRALAERFEMRGPDREYLDTVSADWEAAMASPDLRALARAGVMMTLRVTEFGPVEDILKKDVDPGSAEVDTPKFTLILPPGFEE